MPGARDALCHQALQLLAELCARGALEHDSCQDFIYHLRDRARPRLRDPDISVSLLTLVVTACGLALFGVSLFVSWKLCWVPWRERGLPSGSKDNNQEPLNCTDTETNEQENSEDFLDPPTPCPDSSMKISHTSPDIPLSTQTGVQENCAHGVRVQRQVTEPTSSARHNSIRRQLNLSNPDFNIQQLQKQEQLTGIGRIKPELYKQRSLDNDDGRRSNSKACGKLNFILKYDCDLEQLIVKIHKAVNLPAKDFSGTSDPYVKIYLLPDRKTKHQTKVHRKTLNPVFDEVFLFPVPYNDLEARKLHFSVYDFDRFSRHDLIGQVVVDHFLDLADFPRECILWKDIEYVTNDNVDLGELMFSLCYLPTAGRLTITIIKARNLKAMDITGASDPYVKVSLMCDGRRLKKRKTSTKRNTLNPVYNEAIVFDVPPENIDQIHLSIAVMDYDRVGHNEIIGVCQVGNEAERLGRDHWSEMLSYPRKPIAHWHSLVEIKILCFCVKALGWYLEGICVWLKPAHIPQGSKPNLNLKACQTSKAPTEKLSSSSLHTPSPPALGTHFSSSPLKLVPLLYDTGLLTLAEFLSAIVSSPGALSVSRYSHGMRDQYELIFLGEEEGFPAATREQRAVTVKHQDVEQCCKNTFPERHCLYSGALGKSPLCELTLPDGCTSPLAGVWAQTILPYGPQHVVPVLKLLKSPVLVAGIGLVTRLAFALA
ncbi:synaptotagmin-9 [Piliocolobus tephrosceles]|uniref:synaptotagmin-9 n=1 Tax=Piliocolobus tephrosceles TaxID=591936 RepID=UPI000C29ACA4|nr:synaptotagmin-9 [Piliocolobus tephrosceles]